MLNPSETLLQAMGLCRALDAGQVEEARRHVLPRFPNDPRALAAELLKREWLTPFQINRLVAGRGSELLRGSYVLLERLGEGGMGSVFKARNWKLDRIVALKIIRKDLLTNPVVVGRFRREIEATAQFDHPNLIRAYDADQDDDGLFITMEYVSGIDLGRQVRQKGPLSAAKACDYIRQAALGLQHAHERGMVHRDIKPPNLFRAEQGDLIKVLDLGLARLRDPAQLLDDNSRPALTQLGTVVGTVDFIAPEQARDSRNVDLRADLYSLGCTFYYLATGRPPFPGGTPTEKLLKHTLDPLPQLPGFPAQATAVIHKLMAKKPEDRYQTAAEVAEVLAHLLAQPENLRQRRSAETVSPTIMSRSEPQPIVPVGGPYLAAEPAIAVAEQPAPLAIPVLVRSSPKPTLREQLLKPGWKYGAIGLGILLLLMILPLLFPASTTKGEPTPSTKKPPEPEPAPKTWDGVVREFLVIGPLSRYSRVIPQIEDEEPKPGGVYVDRSGQEFRWKPRKIEENGALTVPAPTSFTVRPAVLFALVHIHSPRDCKVRLHTSSADASRIWVNNVSVLETSQVRIQPQPGDDQVNVSLNAGWNSVMIKLGARGERPFEFFLSFVGGERLRPSLRPE